MRQESEYEGWAIVELMGHRRLAGKVSTAIVGGATCLRIDVPDVDKFVTQFYSGAALYALTPCTEATARAAAIGCKPEPITPWEIRALLPEPVPAVPWDPDPPDNDPQF